MELRQSGRKTQKNALEHANHNGESKEDGQTNDQDNNAAGQTAPLPDTTEDADRSYPSEVTAL